LIGWGLGPAGIIIDKNGNQVSKETIKTILDDFGGQSTSVIVKDSYKQVPSPSDISNAGNQTRYVFPKGNNTVYMYNKNGVTATLPISNFVKFKK